MISPRLLALLGFFAGAIPLAGCTSGSSSAPYSAGPPTGQALADQQTRMACRRRAEEMYNQQNRAEIYAPPTQIDVPASGSYAPGITGRDLGQRFGYEKMVDDCIRNKGASQSLSPEGIIHQGNIPQSTTPQSTPSAPAAPK